MRVSDEGPGSRAEILGRVLEPLTTTKKEGKGSGLGLSLCNGSVQEHGGWLRVQSQQGEGATFIVDVPLEHNAVRLDGPVKPFRMPAVRPLRILVVDDEMSIQEVFVDLLTQAGHHVDTASDVPEALSKIATGAHDLIIADMKMPNGTGLDIYTAILEMRPHLARRIIFITGDVTSDETLDFLRETGNELLLKPCDLGEIEHAIACAVRN